MKKHSNTYDFWDFFNNREIPPCPYVYEDVTNEDGTISQVRVKSTDSKIYKQNLTAPPCFTSDIIKAGLTDDRVIIPCKSMQLKEAYANVALKQVSEDDASFEDVPQTNVNQTSVEPSKPQSNE